MKKELLILRHGKSDWNSEGDDFHRPLKNRGKRGAQRLGVWLQQQQLIPDFILSSPAERAITTAEKVCKAMGLSATQIFQDERLYLANIETLKKIIQALPSQAQRVLIVGHNPALEQLVTDLSNQTIEQPEDGKLLPTATLAHFSLNSEWNDLVNHSAELHSITRASALEKGFPYISLNGAEFRPRPAYYYAQSAVIPYSIIENQLKFLLITNSSKSRWVFPKGIKEPALTPQASAEKEAWEEAGLKGVVGDEALGSYQHQKWDGVCDVQVYPMAVTSMIAAENWNDDRQRQWCTAAQAIELLQQPELNSMIKSLEFSLANYLTAKTA